MVPSPAARRPISLDLRRLNRQKACCIRLFRIARMSGYLLRGDRELCDQVQGTSLNGAEFGGLREGCGRVGDTHGIECPQGQFVHETAEGMNGLALGVALRLGLA